MQTKNEFVAEWLDQNPDWRDQPNRTVAQRLLSLYPEKFSNLDNTRNVVRYVRGANKNRPPVERHIRPHGSPSDRLSLPQSHAKSRGPYHIGEGRILVLSDIHLPYHAEIKTWSAVKGYDVRVETLRGAEWLQIHWPIKGWVTVCKVGDIRGFEDGRISCEANGSRWFATLREPGKAGS